MRPDELRQRLHGVIAFPVTPFKADLSLDLEGLRRNLRSLLNHSISAVVAPAGTGEFYSLSPAEHLAVVKAVVEEAGGRVPVLAAAGFNGPIAVDLARQAAALVERLAQFPNLIGWKDGQADLRRFQMIRQRVGQRLHWIGGAGDDLVPGYYAMGIRTYTSSIANVAPRLSLRLHELASASKSEELTTLMNDLVIPLYALRARRKGYEVSVMKAMMDMIGLAGGSVRPPLVALRSDELESLGGMAERWRPWL